LAKFRSDGILIGINNNKITGGGKICRYLTPPIIQGSTPDNGAGSYTYSWIYSTTDSVSGFSQAPGSNISKNYQPPAAKQDVWYRRIVKSGSYTDTSNYVKFTVMETFAEFDVDDEIQCFSGNSFKFTDRSRAINALPYSWFWKFDDGTFSDSVNPVHKFAQPGYYKVKQYVTSNSNCVDSASIWLIVLRQPVWNIDNIGSDSCFRTNRLRFQDASLLYDGNIVKREWFWSNGKYDTGIMAMQTFADTGMHSVLLVTQSDSMCSDTNLVVFKVHAETLAEIGVSDTAMCSRGNSFALKDNSNYNVTGFTSRNWISGDGRFWNTDSIKIAYSKSGEYDLQLAIVDGNGCKDTATRMLYLYPNPVAKIYSNNNTQCLNQNKFIFEDSSNISSGTIAMHNWKYSDTDFILLNSNVHHWKTLGNHTVTLEVESDSGCADTAKLQITVNANPQANAIAGSSGNLITKVGYVYKVKSQSGVNYQWYCKNGVMEGNTQDTAIKISWNATGTDTVILVSENANQCTDTQRLAITITTVNSITQPNQNNFEIFPNPASSQLEIRLLEFAKFNSFAIYSFDGRLHLHGVITQPAVHIPLETLSNGTYYIKIGNSEAKVFQVQR
jgi:hypothetical protein